VFVGFIPRIKYSRQRCFSFPLLPPKMKLEKYLYLESIISSWSFRLALSLTITVYLLCPTQNWPSPCPLSRYEIEGEEGRER
jgi:hypothetical protein